MMLQFAESTEDLLVVTDKDDNPVFAYDFPHSYTYIAFSTPELEEGIYHVYLGGEIEGTEKDGLYTEITSYTGGTKLHHGGMMANKGFDWGEFYEKTIGNCDDGCVACVSMPIWIVHILGNCSSKRYHR